MNGDERRGFPSLWMYPVARLTLVMGLGVWAVDGWWTAWGNCAGGSCGVDAWLRDSWLADWCVGCGLECSALDVVLLVGWLLVVGTMVGVYRWGGRGRGFGLLTGLAFFLWGGLRLAQERSATDFDWEATEGVYLGRVLSTPVRKGKVFQTEVWVDSQVKGEFKAERDSIGLLNAVPTDTLVERKIVLYGMQDSLWKTQDSLRGMPDSLQEMPVIGDRLVFAAKVGRPLAEVELTGFDYGLYLYRKGISGTAMAFPGKWMVVKGARQGRMGIRQYALRCREWITDRYRSWDLDEEELAVVSALTVGDKSVLSSSLKERYSAAGVSHVLALSGLHVGILSAVLYGLLFPLKRWRWGRRLQALLVVALLWGFAFVTGLSPSVVRAVTMCSLYFLAACVGEEGFAGPYALVLTAFLMINGQPMYVFDVSFQLSFLAVASILYFYPLVVRLKGVSRCLAYFPGVWQRLFTGVWKGMAVSVAAQLGTLPLVLYYFGTFPTYFLVANLVVGVLAGCVLCGALVALLVGGLPYLDGWSVLFLRKTTKLMNGLIGGIQDWEGAQVDGLDISVLQSVCGFVCLLALYRFLRGRRPVYLVVLLVGLNVSLVDWMLRPLLYPPPAVYLYRTGVYLKQDGKVEQQESDNGLYCLQSLRIAVLNDDRWKGKQVSPRISVDYLYICRGCRARLHELTNVFDVGRLVLDASLSDWQRTALKEACRAARLSCEETTTSGSYRIPL